MLLWPGSTRGWCILQQRELAFYMTESGFVAVGRAECCDLPCVLSAVVRDPAACDERARAARDARREGPRARAQRFASGRATGIPV